MFSHVFSIFYSSKEKAEEGWSAFLNIKGSDLSPVETQFCTTPPLLGVLQVSPKLLLIRDFTLFACQAFLHLQTPLRPPGCSKTSLVLVHLLPVSAAGGPGHGIVFRACGSLGRGCDGPSPTPGLQQLPQTPSVSRPWALTGLLTRPFTLSPLVLLVSRSVLCSPWFYAAKHLCMETKDLLTAGCWFSWRI